MPLFRRFSIFYAILFESLNLYENMEKENNMRRKSGGLRALANLAKQRMLNKDYKENIAEDKLFKNKVSAYFLENAKAMKKLTAETKFVSISNKEDEEFVRKVVSILMKNELRSLGELTDKNYYNSLNDREKQLYMLRLSEKVTKIKEEYDKTVVVTEFIA